MFEKDAEKYISNLDECRTKDFMKGYEIALKAVDEIVSAISDECIVGSSDEIVSFEHGKIIVPTKYKNTESNKRLYITLNVNVEYL